MPDFWKVSPQLRATGESCQRFGARGDPRRESGSLPASGKEVWGHPDRCRTWRRSGCLLLAAGGRPAVIVRIAPAGITTTAPSAGATSASRSLPMIRTPSKKGMRPMTAAIGLASRASRTSKPGSSGLRTGVVQFWRSAAALLLLRPWDLLSASTLHRADFTRPRRTTRSARSSRHTTVVRCL